MTDQSIQTKSAHQFISGHFKGKIKNFFKILIKCRIFSKAKNNRKRKLDDLNKEFQEETKKLKTVEQELEKTNVVAENPDEIKKLKENIIDLQIQRDELKNTFETYKKNDPQLFEKKKKATEVGSLQPLMWFVRIYL